MLMNKKRAKGIEKREKRKERIKKAALGN